MVMEILEKKPVSSNFGSCIKKDIDYLFHLILPITHDFHPLLNH